MYEIMKPIRFFYSLSLALAASLMAVSAFAQSASQVFTIKGTIPGIKNGTKISLKSQETGKDIQAECLSHGFSFTLKGHVSGTILVQLKIDDKPQNEYLQDEFPRDRGGDFMLEAADYTVSAACFDSIPLNYDYRNVTMVREKNLKIVGGNAQQQYQEWADATYETRLMVKLLDKQCRDAKFREKKEGGPDTLALKRLKPLLDGEESNLEKLTDEFIGTHPDYAISLLLLCAKMDKPFAFSADQYDNWLTTYIHNYDQGRYAEFCKTVKQMKAYIKGSHYKNLVLVTPDEKTINLADVVLPGKYNFIDFWASWCGPCRAAIPSVKQLYKKLGDKLNIISISVDKKRQDWEKAMEEENMPWQQYQVPQSSMKALKDGYYIMFIPSLVVIDPDGNIQLYTSNPDKAHSYLEDKLK